MTHPTDHRVDADSIDAFYRPADWWMSSKVVRRYPPLNTDAFPPSALGWMRPDIACRSRSKPGTGRTSRTVQIGDRKVKPTGLRFVPSTDEERKIPRHVEGGKARPALFSMEAAGRAETPNTGATGGHGTVQ